MTIKNNQFDNNEEVGGISISTPEHDDWLDKYNENVVNKTSDFFLNLSMIMFIGAFLLFLFMGGLSAYGMVISMTEMTLFGSAENSSPPIAEMLQGVSWVSLFFLVGFGVSLILGAITLGKNSGTSKRGK